MGIPILAVFQNLRWNSNKTSLFQKYFLSRAPIKSVVYDTPYSRANQYSINLVVDLYKTDLEVEKKHCLLNIPLIWDFGILGMRG